MFRRFRNYAQIGGANKRKYDSLVEYVQMAIASNTQYWKTGFVPKGNFRMVLDADSTSVGDTIWCGFKPPVTYLNASATAAFFRYAGASASSVQFSRGRHIFEVGQDCKIDGVVKYSTQNSISGTNKNEVYLFDGYKIYGGGPKNLKVYSFRIYDENDNLVVDMVPCRKNGKAEFYDRVKGDLSERVGDGSVFVVGPDKREYWMWPNDVVSPSLTSEINVANAYKWISLATHQNQVTYRPGYVSFTDMSMTKVDSSSYHPCVVVKLEKNKTFTFKFRSTNPVGGSFRAARYTEGDSGSLAWQGSFAPKYTQVGDYQTYTFDSGDYEWFLFSFYISTVPTTFTEISIEKVAQ